MRSGALGFFWFAATSLRSASTAASTAAFCAGVSFAVLVGLVAGREVAGTPRGGAPDATATLTVSSAAPTPKRLNRDRAAIADLPRPRRDSSYRDQMRGRFSDPGLRGLR